MSEKKYTLGTCSISLRLRTELLEQLNDYATDRGISRNGIIASLIENFLKRNQGK